MSNPATSGLIVRYPLCTQANPVGAEKCRSCGEPLPSDLQPFRPGIGAATTPTVERTQVVLVDIAMPFGSMVRQLVMWSLAAVPAMIILMVVGFVVFGALAALIKG